MPDKDMGIRADLDKWLTAEEMHQIYLSVSEQRYSWWDRIQDLPFELSNWTWYVKWRFLGWFGLKPSQWVEKEIIDSLHLSPLDKLGYGMLGLGWFVNRRLPHSIEKKERVADDA